MSETTKLAPRIDEGHPCNPNPVLANPQNLSFEDQYFNALKNILTNGTVCISGRQTDDSHVTRTKRVWGTQFVIDMSKGILPLMRSKHVAVKGSIQEILWIYQKCSNNVNDLIPKIWNQWADDDGSIRKTYGYQIGKETNAKCGHYPDQTHYVLDLLGKDSSSRHGVFNMWDCETLDDNNCVPCCYTCHFAILDGKLNLMVTQRSADMIIGLPWNISQYAALLLMFARHLGVEPGTYIHNISDAHIYEDQYGSFDAIDEDASNIFDNESLTDAFRDLITNYENRDRFPEIHATLQLDDSSTDFWSITDHNFKIEGYKIWEDCFEDVKFPVTK